MIMLSVTNLSYEYNTKKALDDVSIQVPEGSLCALYGPNKSGKSTLMKCCLKLLPGYTGRYPDFGKECENVILFRSLKNRCLYFPDPDPDVSIYRV